MIHDQREQQTQPAINDCQIATNPYPLMRHLLAWQALRQIQAHMNKKQQAFHVYFASTYTD